MSRPSQGCSILHSPQAIVALSASLPTTGSGLIRRLVRAQNDPGKERVRMWLIDLDDSQLQSGLGLRLEDIAVLRGGTARNPRNDLAQAPPSFVLQVTADCRADIDRGQSSNYGEAS